MGYYLQIDGEQIDQVASNVGWGEYGAWAKTLDPDEFPETRSLYENGWSDEPAALLRELPQAAGEEEPYEDVSTIIDSIIGIMKAHNATEVVSITDGMGEDDESTSKEFGKSMSVESTEPIDDKEKKRRREFLLLLLAFFQWQADCLIAEPELTANAPQFADRLSGLLIQQMTQAAVSATPTIHGSSEADAARVFVDDEIPDIARKVEGLLNGTTAKNVATAVQNGATWVQAVETAVKRAVTSRATMIEDDMNHAAQVVGMAAWFKTQGADFIQWNVSPEKEGVCSICAPLAGLRARPGGEFRPGIRWPVIDTHGNCRCFLTEVPK